MYNNTTSGSSTDTVLVYHSNVVCESIAPIIIELTFDFKPELARDSVSKDKEAVCKRPS